MTAGNERRNVLRFDGYEADVAASELSKNGARVPLELQPFQVLAMLLERPGQVVTRAEIQQKLWPDAFIDFDNGLNTAIRKIRRALDDSPREPKFIETLPRRGYRFVGRVEQEQEQAPLHATPAPGWFGRRWALGAVAGALVMGAIWIAGPLQPSRPWEGPAEIRRLMKAPGSSERSVVSRAETDARRANRRALRAEFVAQFGAGQQPNGPSIRAGRSSGRPTPETGVRRGAETRHQRRTSPADLPR